MDGRPGTASARARAAAARRAVRRQRAPPLKAMLAQDRIAEAERALTYQGYLQRRPAHADPRAAAGTAASRRAGARDRRATRRTSPASGAGEADQLHDLAARRASNARAGGAASTSKYQDRAGRETGAWARCEGAGGRLLAALRAPRGRRPAPRRRPRKAAGQPPAVRPGEPTRTATRQRTTVAVRRAGAAVGGLGWPVPGSLLAWLRRRLPDGRRSDGVLIGAAAGTPVKAVADGTVVYADWMTGYGLS